MPAISVPDNVLTLPRDHLSEFFLVFARFEFACKAQGHVKQGRYGNVEVDWDDFALRLGDDLFNMADQAVLESIAYLENSPPKMETFKGAPRWQDRPAPAKYSRQRSLLFYVQGVRNNLMHGGKFLGNSDPVRDSRLLDASLVVIAACLTCSPDAQAAFFN